MDSVFTKCERCDQPIYEKDLAARFNVCPNCEFHYPLQTCSRSLGSVGILVKTDSGNTQRSDPRPLAPR